MAFLDLIITNLHKLYDFPIITTPLGSSNHNSVRWLPKAKNSPDNSTVSARKRLVRRYPQSGINTFGRWATTLDWFKDLGPNPTVDELAASFTFQLTAAIDRIFPLKTIKHVLSYKPWITPAIKRLIQDRQKVFHSRNVSL